MTVASSATSNHGFGSLDWKITSPQTNIQQRMGNKKYQLNDGTQKKNYDI